LRPAEALSSGTLQVDQPKEDFWWQSTTKSTTADGASGRDVSGAKAIVKAENAPPGHEHCDR
jgi:hypothetical protein